jgi:hypothetical protein
MNARMPGCGCIGCSIPLLIGLAAIAFGALLLSR